MVYRHSRCSSVKVMHSFGAVLPVIAYEDSQPTAPGDAGRRSLRSTLSCPPRVLSAANHGGSQIFAHIFAWTVFIPAIDWAGTLPTSQSFWLKQPAERE
jgi:hypothetical protein